MSNRNEWEKILQDSQRCESILEAAEKLILAGYADKTLLHLRLEEDLKDEISEDDIEKLVNWLYEQPKIKQSVCFFYLSKLPIVFEELNERASSISSRPNSPDQIDELVEAHMENIILEIKVRQLELSPSEELVTGAIEKSLRAEIRACQLAFKIRNMDRTSFYNDLGKLE